MTGCLARAHESDSVACAGADQRVRRTELAHESHVAIDPGHGSHVRYRAVVPALVENDKVSVRQLEDVAEPRLAAEPTSELDGDNAPLMPPTPGPHVTAPTSASAPSSQKWLPTT